MSFLDEIHLKVSSGKGGPGCLSFASSRRQARGGPDGGDGGQGGSVILQVDKRKSSLNHLKKKSYYQAGDGRPGRSRKQKGQKGEDLILSVPPHTWMTIEDKSVHLKDNYILLKGGRGGKGNFFFKTSVNQSPRKMGKGEGGRSQEIYLETRLQADVSLLGWTPLGPCSFFKDFLNQDKTFLFGGSFPYVWHKPSEILVVEVPYLKQYSRFLKHTLSSKILVFVLVLETLQQCQEHYQNIVSAIQNFSLSLLQKHKVCYLIQRGLVSNSEFQKTQEWLRKKNLNVFSDIRLLEGFIEQHIH